MTPTKIFRAFLIGFICAAPVNFVSTSLHPRFEHHGEAVAKELAVVRGDPYLIDGSVTYWPEFQNRLLFGLALQALTSVGILRPEQWYLLLRFALAVAAFGVFWLLLVEVIGATDRLGAATVVLFALLLCGHFNHGWEHPSDYLDPIFTVAFIWATLAGNRWGLCVVAMLAVLNRESAMFAGLLWTCVHGVRFRTHSFRVASLQWREALFGVGVMAATYTAIIGVRFLFGGKRGTGTLQHTSFPYWGDWAADIFRRPSPSHWAVVLTAIVAAPLAWLVVNRDYVEQEERGLLLAALGIFVVSSVFSLIPELRMLIPFSVVMLVSAASTEARRLVAPNLVLFNEDPADAKRRLA